MSGAGARARAAGRAATLRREIWRHRKRYYVDNDPAISDAEYDLLERELAEIEREWPDLATPDSPTQRVGAEVTGELPTARHATPMLSLDNAASFDEVREWFGRLTRVLGREDVPLTAEHKIDGVSVSLIYEDGVLARAVTRGDGVVGEVVTPVVRTIPSLPLRLLEPVPFLEGRGEAYYPIREFVEMNRQREEAGQPTFANPRNAAAGTLRLLDPRLAAERPLDLRLWALVKIDGRPAPATHSEGLRLLADLGLRVNPTRRCSSLDEAQAYFREWQEKRDTLDYEVDGCVVKADPIDLQEAAGATARAPRWAVAWKFPPRQATTRVLGIEINVTRSGALTPTAVLEPVAIGGATISRCTLHNEDEIRRKDVRVGDRVLIERGGDVIPKVVKVILDDRPPDAPPFEMPRACPVCGSAAPRPEGEVFARCVNTSCPARLKESILHFAGRSCMEIEGLGEALVNQLVERGIVRQIPDLYHLDADTLAGLERMGRKSAENLLREIDRSRTAGFDRVIHALGIRFVGERTAELLADAFPDIDALARAGEQDLLKVHEVGPKVAQAILQFFVEPRNREMIARLRESGVVMRAAEGAGTEEGPFTGRTVVVTGSIEGWTREAIKKMLHRQGARVTDAVSKKTDIVIHGADPGAKLDRARALGIRLVDADEFRRLAGTGR